MKFHWSNEVIDVVQKILVSDKFTYGKNKEAYVKYFIRYKNGKKVRQLLIKFLQMTVFFNKFEKSYRMSFVINDEKLLEKYESIWNKITKS